MAVAVITGDSRPRRFRFSGVVVDEGASRLVVDGRPCACSQRALHLLLLLCESPQRTLNRMELLDRLWPGGQIVADEALTQVVFRARAVLGGYAEQIVTVRGVGFRLDAEVESLDDEDEAVIGAEADEPEGSRASPGDATRGEPAWADPEAVTAPSADVSLRPAAESPSSDRFTIGRRWIVLAALLVFAALVYAGRGWWLPPPQPIDVGYALTDADLHAARADSRQLLADAFRHEGDGDRARAQALLETVHASDPQTPIPAVFLALWSASVGDNASADRWLDEAHRRADGLGDPYVNALLAYAEAARGGQSQEMLRRAGAVLDLRPDAWQMHLERARLMLADGYRDAAVHELDAIDYGDLGHRMLVMALADRASLGDPDGAVTVLQRLQSQLPASPRLDYLRGRIAWTRHDFPQAEAGYIACSVDARRQARLDLLNRCLAGIGAVAVTQGRDDDAIRALEQAREGMVESGWRTDEVDLSLMLAQLHAFAGDAAAVRSELDRAESVLERDRVDLMRPWVWLYRQRLTPDIEPKGELTPAMRALQEAWQASRSGDRDVAMAAVERAERGMPPGADWADELHLLQLQLSTSAIGIKASTPADPPYPLQLRLTSRAALTRALDHAAAERRSAGPAR